MPSSSAAQMLTEMARMSLDDGLVLQIHPGSLRNHNPARVRSASAATRAPTFRPRPITSARCKPLLDRFGNERGADDHPLHARRDAATSRELAPLAGHYPALRLGPAWWFYDAPKACGASAN